MTHLALATLALSLPLAVSAQTPKDSGKGTVPHTAELPAAAFVLDAAALPDTLRPGTPALPAAPPGEVAFTVRLLQPNVMDMGTYTETVTVADDAATRVMRVDIPMASQNETVTTTLDPTTLALRSIRAEGNSAVGSVDLADGVATGERAIADSQTGALGATSPVRDAVPGPVFGSGWEYVLLPALPLQAGDVYLVETYGLKDGLGTATVTALGEVTLKRGSTPTTYLAVEVENGEAPWTYYLDPTTRELRLIRFSPQAGVEVEFDRR